MIPDDRRTDWLICTAASILFCLLTLQHLRLPGPNTDEVFTAAPAVNFYNNTNHSEPPQIDPSIVPIFGRGLPLMLMTYVGGVQTFLYVPVFLLFGDSIEVVRVVPIVLAVIALWFAYFLFKYAFDRTVAVIAVFITVADPGFVFFVGRDFGPPALALLCKTAGLYFLLRWWRGKSTGYLMLASFVWGIGVYHKADFLWIIGATVVSALLLYYRELKTRLSLRVLLGAAAMFCFGALPFLVMNMIRLGVTFTLFGQSTSQVNPFEAYVEGVGIRAQQTWELMSGVASFKLFMGESPSFGPMQTSLPLFVAAGLLLLAIAAGLERDARRRKKHLFIGGLSVLVFLFTAKSPTTLMDHHLMALYPLIQGTCAAGWGSAFAGVRARLKTGILTCILIGILGTSVAIVQQTYGALEKTGGRGYWSDAVYDLAAYLRNEGRPIAAMNWGFTANLIVVSKGSLTVHRVYKEFFERGYHAAVVEPYIAGDMLYLFRDPSVDVFAPTFDALGRAASAKGFVPELQASFTERDGREVYRLYHLRQQ